MLFQAAKYTAAGLLSAFSEHGILSLLVVEEFFKLRINRLPGLAFALHRPDAEILERHPVDIPLHISPVQGISFHKVAVFSHHESVYFRIGFHAQITETVDHYFMVDLGERALILFAGFYFCSFARSSRTFWVSFLVQP